MIGELHPIRDSFVAARNFAGNVRGDVNFGVVGLSQHDSLRIAEDQIAGGKREHGSGYAGERFL